MTAPTWWQRLLAACTPTRDTDPQENPVNTSTDTPQDADPVTADGLDLERWRARDIARRDRQAQLVQRKRDLERYGSLLDQYDGPIRAALAVIGPLQHRHADLGRVRSFAGRETDGLCRALLALDGRGTFPAPEAGLDAALPAGRATACTSSTTSPPDRPTIRRHRRRSWSPSTSRFAAASTSPTSAPPGRIIR